jgi:hypothetical protein
MRGLKSKRDMSGTNGPNFHGSLSYPKEGCVPTIDELAALSPYQTRHIKRFGNYEIDLSAVPVLIADDLTFAVDPPAQPEVIEPQ